MTARVVLSAGALALLLGVTPAFAGVPTSRGNAPARVSFVQGEASFVRGGARATAQPNADAPWRRLRAKAMLRAGDTVRTQAKTRVELTLGDGSRLRLGPDSMITLQAANFLPNGERRVSVRMWLGRLWAHVAKRLGGSSAFEVHTRNAVAGVRGTSFAVMAQSDLSSVVKVYTGTVGVRKRATRTKGRVEVSGPERVDRKQWEEVIATAMRQVQVTQLGQIRPAEDFVDVGTDRAWAEWNQARDAQ